ncbi:MAG: S8 family serine peptidase [Phycisphaerae bacterium]|nr:S8 family serine peptidase [Phycisphaerales bacterium]
MRFSMGVFVLAVGAAVTLASGSETWSQLSLDTCGVNQFLAGNPNDDGRGVVIAVLDTGVDPTIPGLTNTPDGAVKVVDVQDFSGEGDIDLHIVRRNEDGGSIVNFEDEGAAIKYALPKNWAGAKDERRFWFGSLDEKRFVNASIPDLDDNGSTDDKFGILVSAMPNEGDDQAICYVDTNHDRSFADEVPIQNYKLAYDLFTLSRPKPEKQIVPLAFAVNIFLNQSKIVLHYDDGAHGTHVAGIAAGYKINGQDGFNGVAPGAKIISLKIGNNAIGGISTTDAKKKAMEYAARYSHEHGVPVVCNLSYGVASTIEGRSAIDTFMDDILHKYPDLTLCTSAGNIGPGLSTVGTPAASAAAITVGALLAPDSARDVQGYSIDGPIPTVFTSRGGETAKPDIATPGWSTSTVPRWSMRGDYWAGTSMASPYASGLCALMISHTLNADPKATIRSCDIKRALCDSCLPLKNSTALDFGFGLPNATYAAKQLAELAKTAKDDPVIGYDVSTPCPSAYEGTSSAAYWRSTYFPKDEPQAFTIKPIFAPGIDGSAKTSFTRKFTLRSDSPWCRLRQESVYLRSVQPTTVFVDYLADELTEPGVYVAAVDALWGEQVAFRMLNTIIVPYRVTAETDHALHFGNQTVHGWTTDRYFVSVPPGASSMVVDLSAPKGAASKASIERIFDPNGHQSRNRGNQLDSTEGKREVSWTVDEGLMPGVWELDIVSDRPDKSWPYDLDVRFFGLHASENPITKWASGTKGTVTVTNEFDTPLFASASGQIEGFRKTSDDKFKGLKDVLTYDIELGDEFDAVRIILEMSPKDYAETTDISVAVEDSKGTNLLDAGFSDNLYSATVSKPKSGGDLKLKITGAFAVSDDQRKTPITVKIDHMLADPVDLEVTRGDSTKIDFVPHVPIDVKYQLDGSLPKAPKGAHPVGYIHFTERNSKQSALKIEVDMADE